MIGRMIVVRIAIHFVRVARLHIRGVLVEARAEAEKDELDELNDAARANVTVFDGITLRQ